MITSSVTKKTNRLYQSGLFISYTISVILHLFIISLLFVRFNTRSDIDLSNVIVTSIVVNSEIELIAPKAETLTVNKELLQKNKTSKAKKIDNAKHQKKQAESIKNTATYKEKVKSDTSSQSTNNQVAKSANTGAKEIAYYSQQIQQEIAQKWQKPYAFNVVKPSIVRIKLDAKGNIIKIELTTSSNNKLFDESIIQAIESSSPLETVKKMDTKTFTNNFTTINLSFNPEDLD